MRRKPPKSGSAAAMHRSPWPRSSGPSERLIAPPPPPTAALYTYAGGVSFRRGDGVGTYLPPAHAGILFLHSSVACIRASVYSRIASRFFCSSAVSGGILPSGGSTIIEVRLPVRRCEVKTAEL